MDGLKSTYGLKGGDNIQTSEHQKNVKKLLQNILAKKTLEKMIVKFIIIAKVRDG